MEWRREDPNAIGKNWKLIVTRAAPKREKNCVCSSFDHGESTRRLIVANNNARTNKILEIFVRTCAHTIHSCM